MHSETAGTATPSPTMNLEVISHQTGATSSVLPLQMIELRKKMREPVKVQAMYSKVPKFRALQCQGRGRRTRIMDIGATTWKATSIAGMLKEKG